jgi:hypothetical protein
VPSGRSVVPCRSTTRRSLLVSGIRSSLKVKIGKVTAILVLRSAAGQLQATSGCAENEHSAVGDPGNQKLCTVRLGQNGLSGTNRRLAVFKIVWQIVWGNFSYLVFNITFPKIIACNWNSLYRRVSTSATICDNKLGSKIIFWRKYGNLNKYYNRKNFDQKPQKIQMHNLVQCVLSLVGIRLTGGSRTLISHSRLRESTDHEGGGGSKFQLNRSLI